MEEEVKKTRRQQKKDDKIRAYINDPKDIAYRGPLSYRYLRVIAWLAIAVSQIVLINNIFEKIGGGSFLNTGVTALFSAISTLSIPLFLIAAFSLILNRNKSYKRILITYSFIYLAIGFGVLILFERYIITTINAFIEDKMLISTVLGAVMGGLAEFNIFSDLFALSLVHFFINYTPSRHFQGNKIKLFRALVILPLVFIIISVSLKVLNNLDVIILPLQIHPFLTTKSFMVHILFIIISLWMKNREKAFIRLGGTHEQYEAYLKTNRNSLAFSLQVCFLFFIFSLIDFFATGSFFVVSVIAKSDKVIDAGRAIGLGQCTGLFIAIPFILLFSYTRKHKNGIIDMFIPALAIILIAFIYLESVRAFIIHWANLIAEASAG